MGSVFCPRLVNGSWGKALLFHHFPRYAPRPALLAAAFAASEQFEGLEDVQMHSVFDKSLC